MSLRRRRDRQKRFSGQTRRLGFVGVIGMPSFSTPSSSADFTNPRLAERIPMYPVSPRFGERASRLVVSATRDCINRATTRQRGLRPFSPYFRAIKSPAASVRVQHHAEGPCVLPGRSRLCLNLETRKTRAPSLVQLINKVCVAFRNVRKVKLPRLSESSKLPNGKCASPGRCLIARQKCASDA